jgi:uncharacterized membrane protein
MAALIGLFVGALVGNVFWHEWGAAFGGIAGFFAGVRFSAWRTQAAPGRSAIAARLPAAPTPASRDGPGQDAENALARRIGELETRVARLEHLAAIGPVPATALEQRAATVPETSTPSQGVAVAAAAQSDGTAERGVGEPENGSPDFEVPATPEPPPGRTEEAAPVPAASSRANRLWTWFTGGNALTRIGVVILFFGVAFLLKYFAEHFTVPIELRLAAVAGGGFALTALGMRLAASRPGYGLSLQGAGAGVLYLTTYAAFRLYGVLPEAPAVALLIAVSALTIWLAVRNDSQPLAGLAIAGGFLAPVLVGNDGGPVMLFGYFALLNASIFALAWSKAWRSLNAVGFVFTFVLGLAWGAEYYGPEHYATVQPFLALFFVFYVAIAVRYARRGPLAARDPVDGLLVFGVPLVGFALQAALVRDFEHGAAWSALAMAVFYALLSLALRKRGEPGFPLLSRAFLVLAVIFATIAIPFALDNRWTAAFWAVEAAGVYWIGVRQSARLARAFALVVEIGAGIVFVVHGAGGAGDPLFANAFFAGAVLIAVSGLVTAWVADRAGSAIAPGERSLVPLVFAWGALWWLAAGGFELVRQLPRAEEVHAVLAWVVVGVALALVLARPLAWPRLAGAGIALLPTMAVAALGDIDVARTTLTTYGWIVWPCAWFVHWGALHAAEALRPESAGAKPATLDGAAMRYSAHAVSTVALIAQIAWEASEWTGRTTAHTTAWTPCAAALPAIAYLWLVVRFRDSARWPLAVHRGAYAVAAGTPIAGLLAVWFFAVNVLSPGDPFPLPYVPLANPLDITLAFALWAVAAWTARFAEISERARYRWIGTGLFVALNGVVLRTAHHWGDVPWRLSSLLASKPLQAALTLAWTLTALAAMVAATTRRLRPLWMLGAALLAAVVAKLFLVDLGALSGLPRVIAFLGVGILLLVIGFLSPLPPAAQGDEPRDKGRPGT